MSRLLPPGTPLSDAPTTPPRSKKPDETGCRGAINEYANEFYGLLLYIVAALSISLTTIAAKVASRSGAAVQLIIVVRCAIAAALALGNIFVAGDHPLGRRRKLLMARGGVGCFGIIGQIHASAHLPTALVSVFGALALKPAATPALPAALTVPACAV